MVNNRRRLGNINKSRQPEPKHVMGHAPASEPITMIEVRAMMRTMLDRQIKETKWLLRENKDELTAPSVQTELNKEWSEEGNCSRVVRHVEQRRSREDNTKEEVDIDGCKYGDFMASQPPSLFRRPTRVAVMDWIYEWRWHLRVLIVATNGRQSSQPDNCILVF